jgi:outer membrane protein assembly factor BamA
VTLPRPLLSVLLLCHALIRTSAQDPPADTAASFPIAVLAVTMEGNTTTRPRVIQRELLVNEGDTIPSDALYARLERSRQNLLNLSLFNTVDILPLYVSRTEVVVQVRVNERWYLWPSPIIEVADPNFNTWWRLGRDVDRLNFGLYLYRYNFRGLNETVYLKFQFGYAQQYALRYKVPNLDRRQRWGASIGGGYYQQKEITIGTLDNERVFHRPEQGNARTSWSVDGDLTLRPHHDLRHIWRLTYASADVSDSVVIEGPGYFDGDATHTGFLAAGYSLIWDTRDSRAFARAGTYAELKIDRLGLAVLDENAPDITTVHGTAKRWWQAGERFVISAGVQGRTTLGGHVPYYVQEGLGYRYTVRGYEYYVVDGQHFVLGRTNFLYALIRPRDYYLSPVPLEAFRTLHIALYVDLFADAGRVWDDQQQATNPLNNAWLSGVGLGLDLVTSYDQVLRAEYSLNALGEDGIFLHFTQPF